MAYINNGFGDLVLNDITLPIVTTLAEGMPGGFFIYQAEGDQELIHFNNLLVNIYGCDGPAEFNDLVKGSFKNMVHPDDYDMVKDEIKEQQRMSGSNNARIQYRIRRKDGTLRYVNALGHRTSSDIYGDICYVFVEDITDSYKAALAARQIENLKEELVREQEEIVKTDVLRMLAEDYTSLYYYNLINKDITSIHTEGMGITNSGFHITQGENVAEAYHTFIDTLVHPEDRYKLEDIIKDEVVKKVLAHKKRHSIIFRRMYDGQYKYCKMIIAKVDDINKTPTLLAIGFADIDAEQRAKMELERLRGEEEYMQKTRELHTIISTLSEDYEVLVHVNFATGDENYYRTSERFLRSVSKNYDTQDFNERIENFARLMVIPEDQREFIECLDRDVVCDAISSGKPYVVNFRMEENGQERWYEVRIVDDHSLGEDTCGIMGFRNIDKEIRAERERLEVQRLAVLNQERAIMIGLSEDFVAVLYVDLDEDMSRKYKFEGKMANKLPARGEKYSFSERVREVCENLVHPDDREMFMNALSAETIKKELTEKDVYHVHFRILVDGVEEYYQCKMLRDEMSNRGIVVGFKSEDDLIRKELENRRLLEEANQAKTTFLFNMSHDIRTPMNAIIGFTTLAQKYLSNQERVSDYLGKIQVSSEHLLDLINEVLDMSRVESGKIQSNLKPVDIIAEAEDMMSICQESADQNGVELINRTGQLKHPLVYADELHISQIIMNVLSNGIKYTPAGGKVYFGVTEVPCEREGFAKFEMLVEDTGIGMSQEFLAHIFDSFAREETATISGIEGTGLGMAIVKRLSDLVGGQIDIQSQQGVGTKVTFTVEFEIFEDEVESPKVVEVHEVSLDGKRTLLVEDNMLNREIAQEFLEDEGIVVECAENGQVAVDMVKAHPMDYYDFVLMDIQMPIMDGYQATAAIRALDGGGSLPIIALSANAFEEDRQKSREAGMNDHIAKPINIDDLLVAVRKVL